MNGTDVMNVLERIGATKSRTEKEAILRSCIDDPLMQKVLQYAYDPFITFGITPPKPAGKGSEQIANLDMFWPMLDALAEREATGSEAHRIVSEWLNDTLDEPNAKLAWRILSKDLRCGISEKTINKVLPGTIPTFEVMLAHKYEPERIKRFPVAVEPKLDGFRTIGLIRPNGYGGFFSRGGKPFPALEHIVVPVWRMLENARSRLENAVDNPKLRDLYWKLLGGDTPCVAIDAEAVSGSFNKTSGDTRRKEERATDALLHVFDVLPYALFAGDPECGELKIPYKLRRRFTEFVVSSAEADAPICLMYRYLANSHEEIQTLYQRFRARKLEGAMVKTLDGGYEIKRSYAWLKIKAQESVDVRVIGAFEGTGKYEGMLGGLIVDVDGVEVRVGGGFSDDQRRELWSAYKTDREYADYCDAVGGPEPGLRLLGRLVEVEYHEKTPDGSLRHPRFKRFRDDKDTGLGEAAE